jgi:septum formation protein
VKTPHLILASASPARLHTLDAAGIDADVIVSGVDESTVDSTQPDTLSLVLARMKAEAVVDRIRTRRAPNADNALVLGCDSVLYFDGQILGKPTDAADATQRWRAMRGSEGVLHTGHCLISTATGARAEANARTTVRFADISDEEIAAYVDSGEPLQVAGAFTIDGRGSAFVSSIDGDHGTVVGLSMPLLRTLLAQHGVQITDLWRKAGD